MNSHEQELIHLFELSHLDLVFKCFFHERLSDLQPHLILEDIADVRTKQTTCAVQMFIEQSAFINRRDHNIRGSLKTTDGKHGEMKANNQSDVH